MMSLLRMPFSFRKTTDDDLDAILDDITVDTDFKPLVSFD